MAMTKDAHNNNAARRTAGQTKSTRSRDAIIEAAQRLFQAHGFMPTTLEKISREAGVGTATVYNHFDNKNVIAGHVFRPIIEDLLEDPQWTDESVPASLALVTLIAEVTLRARAHTQLTIALLEAVSDSTARRGAAIDRDDPRYWVPLPMLFTAIIRRGQASGDFLSYPVAEDAGPLLSNFLLLRVLTRPSEAAPDTTRLVATIAARLFGFTPG